MGRKRESKISLVRNLNSDYSKHNGDLEQENKLTEKNTTGKNQLSKRIVNEFKYISNLFELLDIDNLNQGRKKVDDEDDDEDLELTNIPEKKIFKKTPSKKTPAMKSKSYPNSIEDLEKELEELKGAPMTYQKQMRKKGLQVRLTKKKRKENLKQQKAALKQGTKLSGPGKLIKPVLNSDGNVVSNKFDFADSEIKKEIKRKHTTSVSDFKDEQETKKKIKNLSNGLHFNDVKHQIKKESSDLESNSNILTDDNKPNAHTGPLFNKDNKMVFSKVSFPDNYSKPRKKKVDKDPRKILQKIKDDSKKLTELEKEDKEKAVVLKEKQKWSIALKRASGEKVKDDPELLKKSIMKEKNKKMRSQKKWQDRINRVEKEKDERQKKRKDNIQARIQENKKRKMKKAVKKGRFVQV